MNPWREGPDEEVGLLDVFLLGAIFVAGLAAMGIWWVAGMVAKW